MNYTTTKDKAIIQIEDTSPEFSYDLKIKAIQLINKGIKKFTLDMKNLQIMNCCLLGVIIFINTQSDGNVTLINCNHSAMEILRKTRMSKVLKIE